MRSPCFRYLLRTAEGHYLGEFVTDRYQWLEGDEFTDNDGRRFQIATIEPSKLLGAIHATWTVEAGR